MNPMHLPWTQRSMPHFIVDINRDCNITCAACYNRHSFRKSLADIEQDLQAASSQRRLHTVTIAGGEPTLHPDLPRIVERIRARGLRCVLLTNGLTLDEARLLVLRQAGLDLLLLHIDSGQTRPDLPSPVTPEALAALRREKIAQVSRLGLDVGLVITLYPEDPDDLERVVHLLLASPHAHFLLATLRWPQTPFTRVHGTVARGFRIAETPPQPLPGAPPLNQGLADIRARLAPLGMSPFACIGSSAEPGDPRWLCYTSAVVQDTHRGRVLHAGLTSSLGDRSLVRLVRLLTGRYIYYVGRHALRFRIQMLLNAATGGHAGHALAALTASLRPGARLYEKRLVFQTGPTLEPDGTVVHCRHCPDATIIRGHLVPICLSDTWESPESPSS